MADAILGARYQLEMCPLSDATAERIAKTLAEHKLESLVNVRNPLDLTPMSNEDVYEASIRAMMADSDIDAVIVAIVPLTPQLRTTAEEITEPGSLTQRLPALLRESSKPMIAVIDSGERYEPMTRAIRAGGVPVFRSADQAVRSLGRYLCHRAEHTERLRGGKAPRTRPAKPAEKVHT